MPFVPLRFAPTHNYAADQNQQIGQSMMNLGGEMGRIALDMQNDANKVRVDDAMNQVVKFSTDAQIEAFKLTGRDALERPDSKKALPDEYNDKLQKRLDAIDQTLGNDAQRAAFRAQAEPLRARLYGNVSAHMVKEQGRFDDDTRAAKLDGAYKRGAAFGGLDADREAARQDVETVAAELIAKQKLDPTKDKELIAKVRADVLSPFHANVMKGMLDTGSPDKAKAYYEQYGMEMTVQARANFADSIARSANEIEAGSYVRELLTREIQMADAAKQIEAKFARNPDAMKLARSELAYQHALKADAEREQEEEMLDPVHKLLGDARNKGAYVGLNDRNSVLSSLRGASPELYEKATRMFDQHNDELRSERRASESHARAMASSSPDARMNALNIKYDMMNDPDKYRRADLLATMAPLVKNGTLKVGDLEELVNMQAKLRDPAKREEFTTLMTSDERLKMRLQGSYINGKKFTALDKEQQTDVLNKARATAESLLLTRQHVGGQKAGKADVNEIVDSMFTNKALRDTFFGVGVGSAKPIDAFDPEGTGGRVAQKDAGKIPADMRARIEQALRANKIPVTNQVILDYYNAGR